ncbi:MAG: endonuclease III [Candidatus Eisenbacteria bacterium]|uniref:Endonuclease III n=1 Tax=Eiseniibacteriota bacterium TaxID=2212470 RepID=A0A538TW33_UNCEI|nr:MAG: endonuclease III [Candidatus Eisenbacteria bacterium]
MPRKSPRARRRTDPSSRLPGGRRPRVAPGRSRAKARRSGAHPGIASHAQGARRAASRSKAGRGRRAAPQARRARFAPPDPARVTALLEQLERLYPQATTALAFRDPLELLVATILSAQCTDERVNQVTPALFERYPDAAALAAARVADLEALIRPTGFFRAKTRSIRACCAEIVSRHGGQVPRTLEELTALHGVGRKTANVVLGNAFGIPGIVVDTHVGRLARRLDLTDQVDPVKVEHALMPIVPRERWSRFSHWLILHGRRVCVARRPRCSICPLAPHCPRVGVTDSQ